MSAADSADTQPCTMAGGELADAVAVPTTPEAFAATQVTSPLPASTPETPSTTSEPSAKDAPEAPAAKPPVPKDDGVKLTAAALQDARSNYAEHHDLAIEKVSDDMIQTSELGPVYWATKKANLGARGPASQAMQRALKHRPDVKEMYQVLLDSEKTAFRAAWTCSRDFAFTSSKRTTSNVFRKRKEDVGVFKTQLQLEVLLGGSHQTDAVLQAKNYISMCLRDDLKAGLPQRFGFSCKPMHDALVIILAKTQPPKEPKP